VVFKLHAHLVFIPKYRRKVLTERVFAEARAAWAKVCADFDSELIEANYEPAHVHLLVSYPPKVALSRLVNSLKGVSARRVRARRFPEVTSELRGPAFWSASYCAVSCGGAPLEILKTYILGQAGSSGRAASSPPIAAATGRGFRGGTTGDVT
jgi:putative transposase